MDLRNHHHFSAGNQLLRGDICDDRTAVWVLFVLSHSSSMSVALEDCRRTDFDRPRFGVRFGCKPTDRSRAAGAFRVASAARARKSIVLRGWRDRGLYSLVAVGHSFSATSSSGCYQLSSPLSAKYGLALQ